MATNKTDQTKESPEDYINTYVENAQKKADSFELIKLMKKWSGFEARMWGPTIIGFGRYHYKYKSGHEGDAPLLGFSPRKAAFSLYVYTPIKEHEHYLERLGKFKIGKACIYVTKLSNIDLKVLEEISLASIAYLNEHHECGCKN
jgi:hypothetical protein